MSKNIDRRLPIELSLYVASGDVVLIFGLSQSTVRNAIKRGTVQGWKMGRDWLLLKSECERQWLPEGFKVFWKNKKMKKIVNVRTKEGVMEISV